MEPSTDTVSPARVLALQHLERVRTDDAYVEKLTADDADARTRRQLFHVGVVFAHPFEVLKGENAGGRDGIGGGLHR